MACILYFRGVIGFSSTLHFVNFILSLKDLASSSMMGDITLQGAHHGAQKSTMTGLSDWMTSASKLLSLISITSTDIIFSFMALIFYFLGDRRDKNPWISQSPLPFES
jgi:hypothetical protein